jgi:hypothetical protein
MSKADPHATPIRSPRRRPGVGDQARGNGPVRRRGRGALALRLKCKRPPTKAAYLCNLSVDPFTENLAARLSCTLAVIPFFSSQRRQTANCLNLFLAWPVGNLRARRSASAASLLTREVATPFGCKGTQSETGKPRRAPNRYILRLRFVADRGCIIQWA